MPATRPIGASLCAAIVSVLLFTAGCANDSSDRDTRDTTTTHHDRVGDTHVSSHDRTTDRDLSDIPRSAEMMEQGTGPLSYKAARAGRVYLYDADDSRLVYSGSLDRGERFTVDPDSDRASIDGKVVYDQNLERKHRHKIYFDER